MSLLWKIWAHSPLCYKLHGRPLYPCQQQPTKRTRRNDHLPQVWKVKEATTSHITHISLRTPSCEDWSFDNGCSRHMTGEKSYLKEVKPYINNYVTFWYFFHHVYLVTLKVLFLVFHYFKHVENNFFIIKPNSPSATSMRHLHVAKNCLPNNNGVSESSDMSKITKSTRSSRSSSLTRTSSSIPYGYVIEWSPNVKVISVDLGSL